MSTIQCAHQDASVTGQVCVHLLENKDQDYHRWFTGSGMKHRLVCSKCRANISEAEINLCSVCMSCFEEIIEEGYWEGIIGQPEVFERTSNLYFAHEIVRVAEPITGKILDMRPVDSMPQSAWIALLETGSIIRIDLTNGSVTRIAALPESDLNLEEQVSLYISADGQTAAVANTYGQHGVVLDLNTGRMTMALKRDNYHVEHSPFPVAFFELDKKPLLIHGTAWNRVDVSDPHNGELLTPRSLPSYEKGEQRPEHYLDYFHCRLLVSPDHQYVADNGWVWSPFGVVSSWSIRRWMKENVWESEDGPSKKYLCQRAYYWHGPLCWIDDHTLAVWGYGDDDEWLIPGVRLFNVESGDETGLFMGPAGSLAFDTYLFSFSQEQGTSIWDVTTGERLLRDAAFCPAYYHHGAKRFLTVLSKDEFRVSRLMER